MKGWLAGLWMVVGLAALIGGSNLFVGGATEVARALNVSDAVIGLTIVAGGTALPELATSVVAAKKGNSGIAIGNVLGSNVLNILFILGLTGMISPMHIEGITNVDLLHDARLDYHDLVFLLHQIYHRAMGGSRPRANLWRLHVVPSRLKRGKSWSPFA